LAGSQSFRLTRETVQPGEDDYQSVTKAVIFNRDRLLTALEEMYKVAHDQRVVLRDGRRSTNTNLHAHSGWIDKRDPVRPKRPHHVQALLEQDRLTQAASGLRNS